MNNDNINNVKTKIKRIPLRDNWVEIKRENVMVGQEYNFNQLTSEEVTMVMTIMLRMVMVTMVMSMTTMMVRMVMTTMTTMMLTRWRDT